MSWMTRLWRKITERRFPRDDYPADWNRFYRNGKLVSASPPNETFQGCNFMDCEFGAAKEP